MAQIKITGDSTIDLSPELLAKYQVETVPLYINMGDKSFQDGVSVAPEDIYSYFAQTKTVPAQRRPLCRTTSIFSKSRGSRTMR